MALTALAGCAGQDAATPAAALYRIVTEAQIAPGDALPQPQEDIVLTLSGALGAAAEDGLLELDLPTLEALGMVEMRVDDRIAEGRSVVFQGVLLQTLLEAAQIDPDVHTLTMVALNDYVVEIPVTDMTDYPVLIATRADGERMPIERYGPLRIVYPFGLQPLDQAIYESRSIWQLFQIRAEPPAS